MSDNTLLIEVGTEELPPKSLNKLRLAFGQNFAAELQAASLEFGTVNSYATPRRLALLVEGLCEQQPEQSIEKRGPSTKAAFDGQGNPTKALIGFMKACGVEDPKELTTAATKKGDYLVYRAIKPGRPLAALLADMVKSALAQLPIERRMRWGKQREEFVRPIQWAVCLYGAEVIPISILGIKAGRQSRGHRFMSQGAFEIGSANDYVESCRAAFVLVDFIERKTLIEKQITTLAAAENAYLEFDPELLEEVTSLVEWPVTLAGGFDKSFLAIPPEVLISAMKEHQRYFHLVDSESKLVPRFLTVSNIESRDSNLVVRGNERVIRPRLTDAAFFFAQDTKTTLLEKSERLKQVIFQTDLGSYYDKASRISALSGFIAEKLGVSKDHASRAGLLCKADLVSDMVGEFPDLQGVMGGYYAKHDAESNDVVKGIRQHYRPTHSGGVLPNSDIASCVALADKIDSLVGLFGINQPPTGSRDPFALRRQSLGVIRICVENQLDLSIAECLNFSADLFNKDFETRDVSNYIIERLKNYYSEQGISGDVVDAATSGKTMDTNLLKIDDIVKTLQTFKNGPTAASIIAANKRVANLLRKADLNSLPESFAVDLATDEAELALKSEIDKVALGDVESAAAKLELLAVLQEPIDRFLDEVLVMVENEQIRNNRLGLLLILRNLFLEIADFSLLQ